MIGALPEKRNRYGWPTKMLVILALLIAIAAVVLIKGQAQRSHSSPDGRGDESMKSETMGPTSSAEHMIPAGPSRPAALPRLVDLGADKCIPCKMMAPILEELKEEYRGRFEVDVIDVWKKPEAGRQWRIRVIPTQIFIDASGKELFRHEGFFSKEDILKRWKQLGVDVEEKVSLKEKPNPAIELVAMRACCEQPKTRIPGWGNYRP